jgi:hypothetical protein
MVCQFAKSLDAETIDAQRRKRDRHGLNGAELSVAHHSAHHLLRVRLPK